jgi:hypothetical protein
MTVILNIEHWLFYYSSSCRWPWPTSGHCPKSVRLGGSPTDICPAYKSDFLPLLAECTRHHPCDGEKPLHLRGCIQKFPDESIVKYIHTFSITRWEATQRVMATKLTILTHKIAIQLHLYHLQFSLQTASPETFGYTLVHYCFLTHVHLCALTEHHATMAYWGVFLTSALDGREWSASRPGRYTPRQNRADSCETRSLTCEMEALIDQTVLTTGDDKAIYIVVKGGVHATSLKYRTTCTYMSIADANKLLRLFRFGILWQKFVTRCNIRWRIQKFPDWVITKYTLITINTCWEATL